MLKNAANRGVTIYSHKPASIQPRMSLLRVDPNRLTRITRGFTRYPRTKKLPVSKPKVALLESRPPEEPAEARTFLTQGREFVASGALEQAVGAFTLGLLVYEGPELFLARAAFHAKLKGSIGGGPNHSNFSDRSSVRILSKFRNVRWKNKKSENLVSTFSKISAKCR